eukprot:341941-Rhodomonas_salina.3
MRIGIPGSAKGKGAPASVIDKEEVGPLSCYTAAMRCPYRHVLSCYTFVMPCPVRTYGMRYRAMRYRVCAIGLRVNYAMSGTDIGYAGRKGVPEHYKGGRGNACECFCESAPQCFAIACPFSPFSLDCRLAVDGVEAIDMIDLIDPRCCAIHLGASN